MVASKEKIPYIILKKPFDTISLKSKEVDKNLIVEYLQKIDYLSLIYEVSIFLSANTKKIYREYYFFKEKHLLTFSEFELLKKYFHQQIAF
jgi:hypothetical protein